MPARARGPRTSTGELLTLPEVAAALNVPLETVRYWVWRARYLPVVRFGPGRRKHVRVRRAVLEALIASGERPAWTPKTRSLRRVS